MTRTHFSPRGGCEAAVAGVIGHSRSEVLVMIFSFTSGLIAAALMAAVSRGVSVSIIADPRCIAEPGTQLPALKAAGAKVLIDSKHKLFHNKVLIADRKLVLTGSFNFTFEAEHSNAENIVSLRGKDVAAFVANFQLHAGHSEAMA